MALLSVQYILMIRPGIDFEQSLFCSKSVEEPQE